MKKVFIVLMSLVFSSALFAADKMIYLPIKDVLNSKEAKEILDPNIKFEFGKHSRSKIIAKDLVANKKTQKLGKKEEDACAWALLAALKTFQERAKKERATKVVNLKGYFKKDAYVSNSNYQCAVGFLMAGVTLQGDIAK